MSPSRQHRRDSTTRHSPTKNTKNKQQYQQQQQLNQQQHIMQQQLQSGSSPLLSPSIPPQNLAYSTWSTASSTSSINLNNPDTQTNNRYHNSGIHREPRSSNTNRRSSSNTAALRYQQQQAQARAHAHVQAQLQAHAHQVHQLSYYQQHMADLAIYITQVFLPSVLPTPEEYQIKEQIRQQLETLADKVSKGAKLLPFGSIASGLALRNSDMDLCYLADPGIKFDNNNQDQNKTTENTKEPTTSHEKQQPSTPTANNTDPSSSSSVSDPSFKEQPDPQLQQKQEEKEEPKEKKPKPTPAEMVMILGQVIQQETAFLVKMLPKARIPIIKLSLPPSLGQPFGLSCDIGFENRLALENTRLLLTYAMVDPRMRTIVLFLKVWSKRRRINDPYLGTLSSYGYVLMVIFYLVNGRKLAVLPNLQQLPPPRVTPPEESVYDGHDIYFFDDLDALPRFWVGMNRENVGELLIEFFRFFSTSFRYTHDVISVRTKGGIVSKESKGWMHDIIEEGKHGKGGYLKIDLNRLCIEDPFQTDYNVARTVTRDGLFTIRGEFMRAVRVLSTRTDRLDVMIRELCEERQEGVLMAPPSSSGRRKSAPNSKTPLSMSLSGNLSREEEEEDDLEEQLLLQQQQALLSAEHQPSYPPLTTRLMQDHIYSQATTSMDARPRYPPESIASEPPPLDRDMDWNHETISNYLSNEIQQLQLQQQQQSSNPQSISHPAPLVPETLKHSKPTASAQPLGAQFYFHRFFQTPGCDNPSPQPSTSDALHKPNTFFYDNEPVETGLLVSPTSIPKHSSGARRRESEFGADEFGSNSRGIGTSRYNPQTMNSSRPPRSMSHSAMNHRRRSEQPQSSNSALNFTGPSIIMPHSSDRGMPDFSLLPLPGPIRFGNFGTAEKLLKQKIENQQRILGRSIPAGFYPRVNGNSSSSPLFQQDLSAGHANASSSLPQDHNNRTNHKMMFSEFVNRPTKTKPDQPDQQQREGMFLTASSTDPSRRRSLSNGACSHTTSTISFEQLTKKLSNSPSRRNETCQEEETRQQGVETPRARSSQSPRSVEEDHQSPSAVHRRHETINRPGSTSGSSAGANKSTSVPLPSCSSPAQLPRKIVFGDVEVSTETAKEVRIKALAAVLRTRRMGSWNSQHTSSSATTTDNNNKHSKKTRSTDKKIVQDKSLRSNSSSGNSSSSGSSSVGSSSGGARSRSGASHKSESSCIKLSNQHDPNDPSTSSSSSNKTKKDPLSNLPVLLSKSSSEDTPTIGSSSNNSKAKRKKDNHGLDQEFSPSPIDNHENRVTSSLITPTPSSSLSLPSDSLSHTTKNSPSTTTAATSSDITLNTPMTSNTCTVKTSNNTSNNTTTTISTTAATNTFTASSPLQKSHLIIDRPCINISPSIPTSNTTTCDSDSLT